MREFVMTRNPAPLAASLAAALLLSACATAAPRPMAVEPTRPGPAFAGAPAEAQAAPRADWWRALNDPLLDRLVERVFAANRDLLAAEAEVRRARALAAVEGWNLAPFGSVAAAGGRQRQAAFDTEGDFVSLDAQASWEVDLFGRIRAGAAAAAADAQGVEEARRGVMSAAAAEAASTYVALRGAQSRLDAARANATAQEQTVRLTEALLAAGRATPLDVARARAQLEATLSAIPPLEAEIDGDVAALDVLAGGLPADVRAALSPSAAPPAPPAQAEVGWPEDLLRRRPDIRQAEARVQAAGARARAARVDWWPRLSFLGTATSLATGISGLGERQGLSYNLGLQLDWPALDFRRNALRLESARAGAEAEFLRYDKAVLSGVRDVEASLSAFDAARRATAQSEAAAAAARQAAELSRVRYREGVDAFFNVLDAERRLAEAEDALAVARTRWALSYVRLGRALGVGWSDAPATRAVASGR